MARARTMPERNDPLLDGFWLGRVSKYVYQLVLVDQWNRRDVQWTDLGFMGSKPIDIVKPRVTLAVGKVTPVSLSFKERGSSVYMPTSKRRIVKKDHEKEASIQKEWADREEKRKKYPKPS